MPKSKEVTEFVDLSTVKPAAPWYKRRLDDMCEGPAVPAADSIAKKIAEADEAYEKIFEDAVSMGNGHSMGMGTLVWDSIGVDSASALGQNISLNDQPGLDPSALYPYRQMANVKKAVKKAVRKARSHQAIEVNDMSDDNKKQNEVDILSSLQVQEVGGRTHLIAVVVDQGDGGKNTRQAVRCHHGQAFSEGYPYDQASDSYMILCVTQVPLGHVPVAYQLTMPGVGDWHIRVPLPEVVINRYLNGVQKGKIVELQSKFASPKFVVQIMQMSGCET